MLDLAVRLYGLAIWTALYLALPVVAAVAITGVMVSLFQTVIGVQDQNVSFGPKIVVVAIVLAFGGAPAVALLAHLLTVAIASLPQLVR